jgi:FkbM family methyltransferase
MIAGLEFWLEQPVRELIESLESREIAIDVGANEGTWTVPLASIFKTVDAVEPDARAADRIPQLDNVDVLSCAIADVDADDVILYKRASTGHNSLLAVHPIGGDGMADVPIVEESRVICRTLENLWSGGADFVKIDIEGGEVMALMGCATPSVWKRTGFVVECHDTFDDVRREFVRLGKEVTRIPHPLDAHPGHCWVIAK